MYLPILTYHRLLAHPPDKQADPKRISVSQAQFRAQLKWLHRLGYRTLSLADYPSRLRNGGQLSSKQFAITFDDGYEEVLTLGLPVLKEFGYTATVFAVSGQLGGCNSWDDGHARLLSADQYKTLIRAGITIGGHTASHVHLPKVSAEVARHEIHESKQQLESILGTPGGLFAYPYGESSPEVESWVREAGYQAAFSCDRAPANNAENLYKIRRIVMFPRNTVPETLIKVQPWYPAYQDFKR
jgi:peptidoglycan/xylan/chitin deacetylase (PgdA/CDA1 family)